MAIDPYKPELAKRHMAFQIAYEQLSAHLSENEHLAYDGRTSFIEAFNQTLEALKDYEQTGRELSEWIAQKNSGGDTSAE